ncbi:MAG: hypothetical protein AAF065_14045, partial [Verrucomicrobiota bacterium]
AIKAASVKYDPLEHEARNREVTHAILEWGCPFAIYWQFYCNEPRGHGYQGFWLVNDKAEKLPLYHTFKDYYAELSEFIAATKKASGQTSSKTQIQEFAVNYFK